MPAFLPRFHALYDKVYRMDIFAGGMVEGEN